MDINTVSLSGILKAIDKPKEAGTLFIVDALLIVESKTREGEIKESIVRFSAFNNVAKALLSMSPGKMVFLNGYIGYNEYLKDGQKVFFNSIKASRIWEEAKDRREYL